MSEQDDDLWLNVAAQILPPLSTEVDESIQLNPDFFEPARGNESGDDR